MSTGTDGAVAESTDLSLDALFDLLAVRERRAMLYYLADHGTVPFDELAAGVAGRGADGRTRYHVSTALAHVHLPRCVDAGVVALDGETRAVSYDANPSLTTWLELARDRDRPVASPGGGDVVTVGSDADPR